MTEAEVRNWLESQDLQSGMDVQRFTREAQSIDAEDAYALLRIFREDDPVRRAKAVAALRARGRVIYQSATGRTGFSAQGTTSGPVFPDVSR